MAAMLVYRNNKIFLLWELTFLCKLCEQIFFCFVHQHGGNANHLYCFNFTIPRYYRIIAFVPVFVYSQENLRFRRVKTADWSPLQVFTGALDLVVAHLVFVFVCSAERTSPIIEYVTGCLKTGPLKSCFLA